MSTATLERRRTTKATETPMPWWGDRGPAPHVQWPKRTIEIPAVWSNDSGRWESPDGRFYFDDNAASLAVRFFSEILTLHMAGINGEVAGRPFEMMDYQKKLLTRPLFGWKHAATGLRRFRKVFAFLPKGAGKSPWGSGTGLYLTGFDGEAASEVYAVAGDVKQARVVHENGKVFVDNSPDLSEVMEVTRDAIFHAPTRSTYQVLSSDASTKHGFRPHAVIFDELHNQPNRDLWTALWLSMAKRRQPVMIVITHAGHDDEGICFEEYEHAKRVLSGTTPDHTTLPVIFELLEGQDWTDPSVLDSVNPGLDVSIKREDVMLEVAAAMDEPRKRNDVLRFYFNVWTNQATAWIPVEWWDKCPSTFNADAVQGLQCAGGLDGAQKIDLFSFAMVWREPMESAIRTEVVVEGDREGETEKRKLSLNYRLHILVRFWIPEETMAEHEKMDRVPYSQWADRGWVTPTEGTVIDYDRIFQDILKLAEQFPLLKEAEIGYDPAFATDIAMKLQKEGFKVVEVLQNYKYMSEPMQYSEALIKAGRVVHEGNRCMRNHVENVAVKTDDAGRIRPVKPKKKSKHIDGVASALGMAHGRLIAQPVDVDEGVTDVTWV